MKKEIKEVVKKRKSRIDINRRRAEEEVRIPLSEESMEYIAQIAQMGLGICLSLDRYNNRDTYIYPPYHREYNEKELSYLKSKTKFQKCICWFASVSILYANINTRFNSGDETLHGEHGETNNNRDSLLDTNFQKGMNPDINKAVFELYMNIISNVKIEA